MTDILIGRNDSASASLDPHYGNRHGMIAGTKRRQGVIEIMGKQMVRTAGSQLGRQSLRSVLGGKR